jgi:hypothetical protein
MTVIFMILFSYWLSCEMVVSFRRIDFQVFLSPIKSSLALQKNSRFHSEQNRIELLRSQLLDLCDQYRIVDQSTSQSQFSSKKYRLEQQIRNFIELLILENPTPQPLSNWMEPPTNGMCPLDGHWKLRFTTAQDAKPRSRSKKSENPSIVTVSQITNATTGILTNLIAFTKNTTNQTSDVVSIPTTSSISVNYNNIETMLAVNVAGKKMSPTELQLSFQTVKVFQPPKSSFFSLFWKNKNDYRETYFSLRKVIELPFPRIPGLQAIASRWNARRFHKQQYQQQQQPLQNESIPKKLIGAYFTVVYVDDDLRIHKTGRGDYFVQSRLYEVWDPMIGWNLISMI